MKFLKMWLRVLGVLFVLLFGMMVFSVLLQLNAFMGILFGLTALSAGIARLLTL